MNRAVYTLNFPDSDYKLKRIEIAEGDIRQIEVEGNEINQMIIEYHKTAVLKLLMTRLLGAHHLLTGVGFKLAIKGLIARVQKIGWIGVRYTQSLFTVPLR